MANQWGRGLPTAGGAGRSASVIFPVIISLIVGMAGGYGYARFVVGSDTTARLSEVTAERDRLVKQVASQTAELDAVSEKLAAATAAASQPRQQDGAEEKVAQLERILAFQAEEGRRQLDALQAEAATAATARDEALVRVRALEKQLAGLRTNAAPGGDFPNLKKLSEKQGNEITRLKAEISSAQARIAALNNQLDFSNATITDLKAQLAGAKPGAETAKPEAEMAKPETVQPLQPTEADRPLEPVLKTETPQPMPADDRPADSLPTRDGPVPDGLLPRDAAAVEQALKGARGLDALTADKREMLKTKLVAGECVTTSLEAVFDRIPVISLRNLIRDLKSGC